MRAQHNAVLPKGACDTCNSLFRHNLKARCACVAAKRTITQRLTIWLQSSFRRAHFEQKCDNRLSDSIRPMSTTHKKVIVRKMDRDTVNGYVSAAFIADGKLELLNTAGNVVSIELREVKGVYFVREFGDSESLTRKTFTSRPRMEGLWVRL